MPRVYKKWFFLAMIGIAFWAVSCNSITDLPAEKPDESKAVFYAGSESLQGVSAKTKTFADKNFSVLWNGADLTIVMKTKYYLPLSVGFYLIVTIQGLSVLP